MLSQFLVVEILDLCSLGSSAYIHLSGHQYVTTFSLNIHGIASIFHLPWNVCTTDTGGGYTLNAALMCVTG